jgi:protein tyrosine/serine phosphatase
MERMMAPASPLSSTPRRIIIAAATIFAASLTIVGAMFGVRFSENFDVVEAGMAYRSGQLRPDELEDIIRHSGIQSIVSLSPPEPDQPWYRGEVSVSIARHVTRYEMPLSPRKELTSAELCQLLTLLKEAPKPVLIHSRNGADTVGLAAAIFRYAIASRPAEEAKNQLSIRYGHFPFLVSGTGAMDASFERFVQEQQAARAAES